MFFWKKSYTNFTSRLRKRNNFQIQADFFKHCSRCVVCYKCMQITLKLKCSFHTYVPKLLVIYRVFQKFGFWSGSKLITECKLNKIYDWKSPTPENPIMSITNTILANFELAILDCKIVPQFWCFISMFFFY